MFKTKLKVMSFILAITMVLSVFSIAQITVSAKTVDSNSNVSENISGNYKYNILDNGTAEITKYSGKEKSINIPSQLDGYTVTSIGYRAFWGCDSLTSITIPNGVTNIDGCAFEYCTNLKSATIPNSVTNIGGSAFGQCSSLTSITIPNSVTVIDSYAFESCIKLTSVTIPDSVIEIGRFAFYNCSNLTLVTIGASVSSIERFCFCDCSQLKNIKVNSKNKSFCDIDGVLFTKDKTQIIQYPIVRKETSYKIPDNVTSIGIGAFAYCSQLKLIEIPNSVTEIGKSAFKDTSWFYNQKDGIVYAGKVAYTYKGEMPQNTSIELLAGTLGIADFAFEDYDNLTSVTLPNTITNIGASAFEDCKNLTSITIPYNVTKIGKYAVGYYFDFEKAYTILKDFTIKGYKGTQAEIYANDNNIPFVSLGEKVITGDVTGDGKLSITDTTLIQKHLANRTTFTAEQIKLADVNKDGKVNIDDCTLIQKVLAGRATL